MTRFIISCCSGCRYAKVHDLLKENETARKLSDSKVETSEGVTEFTTWDPHFTPQKLDGRRVDVVELCAEVLMNQHDMERVRSRCNELKIF